MTLTTHFHLEPKLRMNGGIPPFPLNVFMEWTGIILPFTDSNEKLDGLFPKDILYEVALDVCIP